MNKLKEYKHTVPITDDTAWNNVVPPGYEIEKIIFVNSTSNVAIIDAGSASGGSDIFKNQSMAANDITTVVLNTTLSMSTRGSIYVNDDDAGSSWNSASLTAIMLMRRVLI